MASPYAQHEYASPRPSLASPGLTHRAGKTPRSAGGLGDEGPQHTHFQFNEFGIDVSTVTGRGWTCSREAQGMKCRMSTRSRFIHQHWHLTKSKPIQNIHPIILQRQPSIPEEESAYNNDKEGKPNGGILRSPFSVSMRASHLSHGSPRRQTVVSTTRGEGGPRPWTRVLLGAVVSGLLLAVLASTGFFDGRGKDGTSSSAGSVGASSFSTTGAKKGLRGGAASIVNAGDGTAVFVRQSVVDHHKARVLVVPSLEHFTRRNVHHFDKHDPEGRLLPPNAKQTARARAAEHAQQEDTALHVDEVDVNDNEDRRVVSPPADDVLNVFVKPGEQDGGSKQALLLPEAFRTAGVVKRFHSITGVDKYHRFDVNDYFGSSVTRMGTDKVTGLTTLAVGAPGAQENSGMVYFLTLQKNGQVESYSYLNNVGNSLGGFWTSNVALGWTVENVGDLDGRRAIYLLHGFASPCLGLFRLAVS